MSSDRCDRPAVVLSVDFESWVHAYRPAESTSRQRMLMDDGFVPSACSLLLDCLARHNARATFFVVSEILDWYPETVHEVWKEGHEIALHSHTHRPLTSISALKDEMEASADFVDRFGVRGFRAPRGVYQSVFGQILRDYGIVYDSSSYGVTGNGASGAHIAEVPISAWVYSRSQRLSHIHGTLSWTIIRSAFPIGSGYVLGLLGPLWPKLIELETKRHGVSVVSVHLWQFAHPGRTSRLLRHFLSQDIMSIPYCRNVRYVLERLLHANDAITMWEWLRARQPVPLQENRGALDRDLQEVGS